MKRNCCPSLTVVEFDIVVFYLNVFDTNDISETLEVQERTVETLKLDDRVDIRKVIEDTTAFSGNRWIIDGDSVIFDDEVCVHYSIFVSVKLLQTNCTVR